MTGLNRRDFLRAMGVAGTTTVVGCSSDTARRLIPYIAPEEDVIPGIPSWYASVCRECPAGCGLLAKNRDGRIIKVEGNPHHPVNGGTLCARGQASLHGLYNPDRYPGPRRRISPGKSERISWDQAQEAFVRAVSRAAEQGPSDRVVFMSDLMTGTLKDLGDLWLKEAGRSAGVVIYEPYAYEALRHANELVFGFDGIPSYRLDQADFLISFNAGFLETWLSNVEHARRFAEFHAVRDGRKNPFVFVGPRLSMTAANADLWVPVAPGDELFAALAILKVILDENLMPDLGSDREAALVALLGPWTLDRILSRGGLDREQMRAIARAFAAARAPLALAGGLAVQGADALAAAVAANLLCTLNPGTRPAIDFSAPHALGAASKADALKELTERMKRKDVDLLIVHGANPVFSLPAAWEFGKAVESVPMVVSFSSAVDETSSLAHLVLPVDTPLESWGDYSPRAGVHGMMQPVMGRVFDTRHLGDLLIASGKKLKGEAKFPWKDFYELLQDSWDRRRAEQARDVPSDAFWQKAVETGGFWKAPIEAPWPTPRYSGYAFPAPDAASPPASNGFRFSAFPTVQFFDGRGANRPWLQELPDPITQITWGGWVEIHPEAAAKLGIEAGDMVEVKSAHGTVEAPAIPILTVPPGTVAMPIGQGHTAYGRFADGLPANPLRLFPPDPDPAGGGPASPPTTVSIAKKGSRFELANTDGSYYQRGRELLQSVRLADYRQAVAAGEGPHLDMPLPEFFDPKKDFYPPHPHVDYRWAMLVDLDRCIGCGACVIACYAENNLAIVGREQMLMGREMSWLRVQRYFKEGAASLAWLPMLCQHCDCAPCESVCPVYAPQHSKEGLNNQIYNRCFGTRFCSQNDPYKVRRFNYFTYTRPEPLNWQLNPDVLVRQKGVMEKCSFCVQRIIDAKIKAKLEGRKVRDGEFTTACAQTCPAGVFTFGSLLDPDSRVSRAIKDPRTYQVLMHLNTKPAAFYLKRVTHEIGGARA